MENKENIPKNVYQETDFFINDYIEKVLDEKPVQTRRNPFSQSKDFVKKIPANDKLIAQLPSVLPNYYMKYQSMNPDKFNNNQNTYITNPSHSKTFGTHNGILISKSPYKPQSAMQRRPLSIIGQNEYGLVNDTKLLQPLELNNFLNNPSNIEINNNGIAPMVPVINKSEVYLSDWLKKQLYAELCHQQIIKLKNERIRLETNYESYFQNSFRKIKNNQIIRKIPEYITLNHNFIASILEEFHKVLEFSEKIDSLYWLNLPLGQAIPVHYISYWKQIIEQVSENELLEYRNRFMRKSLAEQDISRHKRNIKQLYECFRSARTYIWHVEVVIEADALKKNCAINFNSLLTKRELGNDLVNSIFK